MPRKSLIVGLSLLAAACAPNPCDASAAVAPGRTVADDVACQALLKPSGEPSGPAAPSN